MESLETFRKELKSELKKFPQDIDLIKELVNEYYIEHFDKNILLNQFDSGVYQFDRISLNEIEEVSKDFGISDDPKINKNVKTRLKQIADQIVVIKSKSDIKKLLKPGINKTPGFICNSNTLGCLKEKLIISAQDLDNLLDILVADFLNPLKRSYLLSSIYTPRLLNEFKFKQKPNEQIFIKTF